MEDSRNAERILNMGMQLMQMGGLYAGSFATSVTMFLIYVDQDKSANLLNRYINKGGNIAVSFCSVDHIAALDRRLKAEGITHVKTYNTELGKNAGMLLYADYDAVKVEKVINQFRSEIGEHGITALKIVQDKSEMAMMKIDNLTYYATKLFSEHAKEIGADISITENNNDCYGIKFNACDKDKVQMIQAAVAVELSGEAGNILKKQLDYENEKMLKIDCLIMDAYQKEKFYVCGLDGSCLMFDRKRTSYRGKEGNFLLSQKNLKYYEMAVGLAHTIQGAVILNEKDYQKYCSLKDDEKKSFLINEDIKMGRPEISEQEYRILRDMRDKRTLYEAKLSMENPVQWKLEYALLNDEMRMDAFQALEAVNKQEMEEHVSEELDDSILEQAKRIYEEMEFEKSNDTRERQHLEDLILDTDLAIDEEKLMRDYEKFMNEYDSIRDMNDVLGDALDDINSNWIPDDYEF